MNILVLFPTATEARYFAHPAAEVALCGVGLTAAAYNTARLIHQRRPDVLILAGIAGVYPGSRLAIGDVALVASEREADLGFFSASGFAHLSAIDIDMEFEVAARYDCPYLPASPPLPLAHGNSLNAALAPFVATDGVDVESMEGAAFFHVCLAEGQRFYEVRAVSNRVTLEPEQWDFDASIRALGAGLEQLIDFLLAEQAKAGAGA